MKGKKPDRCPKCGGTTGLYAVEWQKWTLCYGWDGSEDGGGLQDGKGGKMLYCRDCDEPIMRMSTLMEPGEGGAE